MRTRFYLIGLLIAILFGWSSFMIVMLRLSPFTTGVLALILFYASLFIALSSSLALVIYAGRIWLIQPLNPQQYLNTALRQGVLIALMLNVGLAFQRLRVLTWWDALLLVVIVLLIEFYVLVRS